MKDTSRQTILVHQLSAPRASKGESSTPQPEEPLQINMPTPTTTAAIATIPTTTATTTAGPTSSVMAAPQPQFTYTEVTVSSLGGLSPHININDQVSKQPHNLSGHTFRLYRAVLYGFILISKPKNVTRIEKMICVRCSVKQIVHNRCLFFLS